MCLRGGVDWVGRRRDALLEEAPGQEGPVDAADADDEGEDAGSRGELCGLGFGGFLLW